jgi:multimeric flavodoxin WrbA
MLEKRLLLIWGGHAGGRTETMREAVVAGIAETGEAIELRQRPALEAGIDDLLWCEALLIATPEHFGYMSGAVKDFFDRTFYPAEGRTEALPYALIISAGNDGAGTVASIERIATGYRWKRVAPPLVVVGAPTDATLTQARELGATLAAGLCAGIF